MVAAQLEAAYAYVPPPTNYTPALPEAQLQKGIVSFGDLSRTRQLMHKLLKGEAITAGKGIQHPALARPVTAPCLY